MATGFHDLRVLQMSEAFADGVWRMVSRWDVFTRDVVGNQIARAAGSVGANIAESYGRFHYGEKTNLLYYARGSAFETKYWLNRCQERNLTPIADAERLAARLGDIARQINAFAASLKTQRQETKQAHETPADYQTTTDKSIFSDQDIQALISNDPTS